MNESIRIGGLNLYHIKVFDLYSAMGNVRFAVGNVRSAVGNVHTALRNIN